jgi:hypothetical protein
MISGQGALLFCASAMGAARQAAAAEAASGTSLGCRGGWRARDAARKVGQGRSGAIAQRP